MTDEKPGKEPYPDDMPKPSGWPADDEELPIRGDDVCGKVPYPSEIEETVFGDTAPKDPSVINGDSDGDRTLDELFGDSDDGN